MDPSTEEFGAVKKPPATEKVAAAAAVAASPPPSPSAASASSVAGDTKAKTSDGDKAKGKRTTLSIHEKFIVKTFCETQINECKARADFVPSHDALRQEIAAKFGWEVGRSTLSKIMCMDWQQLQLHAHPNPNMKRKRKPLFPAFEDDLVKSVSAHLARQESMSHFLASDSPDGVVNAKSGHVLTEAIILEEAQRLKQQHGIKDEELVLSVGWLARFKHRNGIRLRKPTGTQLESGEGSSALAREAALQISESTAKRGKTNCSGTHTAQPDRWRSRFHFVSALSGAGEGQAADPTSSISTFISDLHATCISRTTETTEAAEIVPSSTINGIPADVKRFACERCAVSLPLGIAGLDVMAIGFNCVRDAFAAAAMVGEFGSVTCVETNLEAMHIAEGHAEQYATKTLGYATSNLRILSGSTLEYVSSFADSVTSKDLIIFNCSYQNAVHKAQLLEFAFNLLKEGGECRLSYLASPRRLQLSLPHSHPPTPPTSGDELTSTAVYSEDFRRMCQHVGFLDPRCLGARKLELSQESTQPELSIATFRLFKLRLVEDQPEDYGERATYMGDIAADADALVYRLDSHFAFVHNVSTAIDGNTSQILRLSWLKRAFSVEGDRSTHFGRFTFSL